MYQMKRTFGKWALFIALAALPFAANNLAAEEAPNETLIAGHGGGGHGGGDHGGGGHGGGHGDWGHGGGHGDWNRGGNWGGHGDWNGHRGNWGYNRDWGNYYGPGYGGGVDVDVYPQTYPYYNDDSTIYYNTYPYDSNAR